MEVLGTVSFGWAFEVRAAESRKQDSRAGTAGRRVQRVDCPRITGNEVREEKRVRETQYVINLLRQLEPHLARTLKARVRI